MKKILIFVICALMMLPVSVSADFADGGKYLDFSDFVAGENNSYYSDVFQYRGKFQKSTDPEGIRGGNIKFTVSDTAGECFMMTKVEKDCVFGASFYVDKNISFTLSGKGLGNVWGDSAISSIMSISNGSVKLMGTDIVSTVTSDGWIDLRTYIEYAANKIHIYLYDTNGAFVSKSYSLNTKVVGTEYFGITTKVTSEAYDFYVDDVVLYYAADSFDAEMKHGEITDGMMSGLDISFSKDILTGSDAITVTDSKGNELGFDVAPLRAGRFANGFSLEFDEPLDEFCSYTLSLGDGVSSITGQTLSFEKSIFSSESSVVIEPFENSIFETGTSVTLNIDAKKPRTASLWCIQNGEWLSATAEFKIEVQSGENVIYAAITDEEGEIIAESDKIVVFGTEYSITEYNTDDDFDLRMIPIMNYAASGGEAEIIDDGSGHGKVLKLTSYAGATTQSFFASNSIDSTSKGKKVVFEGDFKFADFNVTKSPLLLKTVAVGSTASSWPTLFSVNTSGEVLVNYYNENVKESVKVGSVKLNTWYNFKITVDMTSQTAEWWFEGKMVESGKRPWQKSVTMDKIYYTNTGTGTNSINDTTMYVDNVRSYYLAPNAVYSYDFSSDAPYSYETLEMTVDFSVAMNAESLKNITVTDSNGDAADYKASLDGTSLTIEFADLNPDMEYVISLAGLKTADGAGISGKTDITFKTDKKPFCIKNVSTSIVGSRLKVCAFVRTDNSMDKAIINACVYSDKAMIASEANTVDLSNPGSVKEYTFDFDVSQTETVDVGIYLIDTFETINIVDVFNCNAK